MRTLFLCALAATVVGCSCYAPIPANLDTCTGPGAIGVACLDRSSLTEAIEPEPVAFGSKIPVRTERRPSDHARHKPDVAMLTTKSAWPTAKVGAAAAKVEAVEPAAAKVEPAKVELAPNKFEPEAPRVEPTASGGPAETSDQVIAKAKTTIAAKLDNPKSVEFGEMKRAMRTNMLGKSVDTICGYIKGKKASGGSTEDRPFLYLVREDEAYVVDGPPTSISATAYRNICN